MEQDANGQDDQVDSFRGQLPAQSVAVQRSQWQSISLGNLFLGKSNHGGCGADFHALTDVAGEGPLSVG